MSTRVRALLSLFGRVASAWRVTLVVALFLGVGGCQVPGVPVDHFMLDGHAVRVPGRIDPALLVEDQPYVLTAEVTLPAALHGQAVDLSLPLLEAAVDVRADGRAIAAEPAAGYREAGPRRWTIPATATADGTIALELHVHHRWAKSAWLGSVPAIVPAGAPDRRAALVRLFNVHLGWLAIGVLVQVGLACLLVYVLDRRRRPYLWFGIQAVTAMAYPGFTSGVSVSVWGRWDLLFLELGLVVALGTSLRFTHSFYGLGPVPRVLVAFLGVAGVAAVVLVDPYLAPVTSAPLVAAAVAACIAYQLWTLARLFVREPRLRVSVALLGGGWGALAAGTWVDLVSWLGRTELLGGVRPACASLAVFGVCLSLVLSRSHIVALAHADELNHALAGEVQEAQSQRVRTDRLNEELQRQIADRSAQLFAALALLDAGESGVGALPAGTEINGRYRIERVLGSGAMGMVYLVTQLSDGSRWAMKVANELRGVALARLAREAHIASKLRHANVVQVRDIDVATRGFMYIVLELVEGQSLRDRLRERGPLPLGEALPILEQLARGLAALHAANIAHRDLKPDNVLVTEQGGAPVVKIADFGISRVGELEEPARVRPRRRARAVAPGGPELPMITGEIATQAETSVGTAGDARGRGTAAAAIGEAVTTELRDPGSPFATAVRPTVVAGFDEGVILTPGVEAGRSIGTGTPSSQDLTGTGMLAGTPHYVAPELALGGSRADPRADLWSFGVVAYELLTGKRPFDEAVATRILQRRAVDDLEPPPLPEEHGVIAPLIGRCLAFDPAERPTAAEVAEALAEAQRCRG